MKHKTPRYHNSLENPLIILALHSQWQPLLYPSHFSRYLQSLLYRTCRSALLCRAPLSPVPITMKHETPRYHDSLKNPLMLSVES